MLLVVGTHCLLEGLEGVMHVLVNGYVHFSGGGPEDYDALNTGAGLEGADVFADLLCHVPAVGGLLDVVSVEALGVVVVESCGQCHDLLEFVADGLYVLFLKDLGVHGRLVCVDGIYVPCAEDDVVEVGQGDDVFIVEILLVVAAAHADFVVLGHGAYGLSQTFAGHEDAGHEGGGDGSEADDHHAELSIGFGCFLCHCGIAVFCLFRFLFPHSGKCLSGGRFRRGGENGRNHLRAPVAGVWLPWHKGESRLAEIRVKGITKV